MSTTRTKMIAITAGIAAAVSLAACSSGDNSSSPSSVTATTSTGPHNTTAPDAPFNDADVMFAQMMYPHHAQAISMAELVDGRTTNPDITTLAAAIEATQHPEMTQLSDWLIAWGHPAPTTDESADKSGTHGDMNHGDMDHGDMDQGDMDQGDSSSGMMSQQQFDDLSAKSGPEFDQAWLTMMIEHHDGAVDMAEDEIAEGINPDAKAMAQNIITTQQREIEKMNTLLN